MRELLMPTVEGYDPAEQPCLRFMAAQLDDQLRRLKTSVAGLDVPALEWQLGPGHNSVGMLLAHIAVAETWWMQAGAKGLHETAAVNKVVKGIIGIETHEDGLPLAADGAHPDALRGTDLAGYLSMIDRARLATHVSLRSWRDADLDEPFVLKDTKLSKGWILYHVLEHMVAHYGQILLLTRLRTTAP